MDTHVGCHFDYRYNLVLRNTFRSLKVVKTESVQRPGDNFDVKCWKEKFVKTKTSLPVIGLQLNEDNVAVFCLFEILSPTSSKFNSEFDIPEFKYSRASEWCHAELSFIKKKVPLVYATALCKMLSLGRPALVELDQKLLSSLYLWLEEVQKL